MCTFGPFKRVQKFDISDIRELIILLQKKKKGLRYKSSVANTKTSTLKELQLINPNSLSFFQLITRPV